MPDVWHRLILQIEMDSFFLADCLGENRPPLTLLILWSNFSLLTKINLKILKIFLLLYQLKERARAAFAAGVGVVQGHVLVYFDVAARARLHFSDSRQQRVAGTFVYSGVDGLLNLIGIAQDVARPCCSVSTLT